MGVMLSLQGQHNDEALEFEHEFTNSIGTMALASLTCIILVIATYISPARWWSFDMGTAECVSRHN